jgi:hypothetical protein
MRVEAVTESLYGLRESKDFETLARLGHELSEGSVDGGVDLDAPMEAIFQCRFCGDEIRFRDLAWGLAPQPLWVLSDISGGDPNEDCRARRMRRTGYKRVIQGKLLERWKRLRWTAPSRDHFN